MIFLTQIRQFPILKAQRNPYLRGMKLKNDLLLRAARQEQIERPPVWLMRQAGRTLPGYREIRASVSGFKELVETPELAATVTIEPVDVHGVDAAIIFSDILVIPEAMGLPYQLIEKKGPFFPKTIQSPKDVDALQTGEAAAQELHYVYEAVQVTKQKLAGRVPLIGFAGAPWTLFSYMLEGQGTKTFSKAKKFLYQEPKAAHALMDKITNAVIAYLKQKVAAGVDLVQVFDSWAGALSPAQYREFALPYLKRICDSIQEVPVTVFAKGAWFALPELGELDCNTIGLDWNTSPQHARTWLGEGKTLQGNLDPCQLYGPLETIEAETRKMLDNFGRNHIANLGHGVYPDIPVEAIQCFVKTVQAYRY